MELAATERALMTALNTIRTTGPNQAIPLDPAICAQIVESERWAARVSEAASGCIEWEGNRDARGYGFIWVKTRNLLAHRVSYVANKHEDIPAGFVLDHLCRNPSCINPEHLEAVSQRVNVLRGTAPAARQAAQITCIRGHELKPRTTPSRGGRYCPTCAKASKERYRAVMNEARLMLGLTQKAYVELHGQSVATAAAIIAAKEKS